MESGLQPDAIRGRNSAPQQHSCPRGSVLAEGLDGALVGGSGILISAPGPVLGQKV